MHYIEGIKLALILCLLLCDLATLSSASERTPSMNNTAPSIESLHWLAGCWAGEIKGTYVEECWMEPRGGMMPGVNRSVKNGKAVFFEYLRIEESPEGLVYIASPMGKSPTVFTLKSSENKTFVFENLAHDFPQRIIYQLAGEGTLKARVEGMFKGRLEIEEWTWHRAALKGEK
jgi:hypothetical protein